MTGAIVSLGPEEAAEAIAWRHTLHAMPELAFNEHRTSAFVAERLASFGLEVSHGLAGTGVVATLRRGTSRRTVGLRADMDALAITEATGLAYASANPGLMHACGHDGHMAMLLAAARSLADADGIEGTIHFIFQPAEENEGGGRRMVEEGLFESFPMDAIFGVHNWPALAVGEVGVKAGPVMAAFAVFDITITGRGSHAAMPHQGADPIIAAFQIGSAMQMIVSRNLSPLSAAVVSVTQVHAGDTYNVIPDTCRLAGTVRWFDPAAGEAVEKRLAQIVTSLALGLGCTAETKFEKRYPATVNSGAEAAFAAQVVRELDPGLLLVDVVEPSMAAEDFSFMLEKCPGAYLWLGAGRTGENPGLHSPRFDFNDAILPSGVTLWTHLARQWLAVP